MVCLARQVGTQWTSDGHRLNKRWAFIAHAVFTECPKAERFLGTPCRSAALLLCIMLHYDFVILKWRFLWYFYQINDTSIRLMILLWYFLLGNTKCIILLSYYMSVIYLYVQQKKMILWYFFHKKLFSYEHMLNGKSKKYLTELSHIRKLKELRELRS